MSRKIVLLALVIMLTTGFVLGDSEAENEFETISVDDEDRFCTSDTVGETSMNITSDNESIYVEGVYCASTGGYNISDIAVDVEQEEVNVEFDLESPEEGATQVLTPVELEHREEVDEGTYTVVSNVNVDSETVDTITEEVAVGSEDIVEETPGLFARFANWLDSLF